MRHSLIKAAIIISLIGAGQTGQAQGVRLTGTASQSFSLDNTGSGYDFDAVSSLGFGLNKRTRNTSVGLSSGLSMVVDQNGVTFSRPQLRFNFGYATKDVNYNGALSFARGPATIDVIQPDLSVLTYSGDRSVYSGNVGASYALNNNTSMTVGISGTRTDYDPVSAGLVPSSNLSVTGGFSTQATPVTSYGANAQLGFFEAENASNTMSVSADLSGTFSHQLDQRTSLSGNLGLSFVETTDTFLGVETSNFTLSALFGLGASYALPDGAINIGLNQTVVPGSGGSLVINTSLGGSYSYQVNRAESLDLGVSLNRQENLGGGAQVTVVSISPSYSRQLTRDINANANAYLQQDNSGNSAHGFGVSLTRAFDFGLF